MCKKKLELILQKFTFSCKMFVLHRHTKIMCFSSTSTGLPHSHSPRTLPTSFPTHHAYDLPPYSPPSLSIAPLPTPLLFIHPLSLSGRRCAAVAAQRRLPIMKNAACKKKTDKTQWELKQKRLTCETQRAIAQKFAQQLFIFLQCVCVYFVFVLSSYWQFYFVQIYATLCSADLSRHTHTYTSNVASASAVTVTATEAFCVYFFSMKCV